MFNWLTLLVLFIVLILIIYIYCSKKLPTISKEDLTLLNDVNSLNTPFCASKTENDCINSPGCEYVIGSDGTPRCQSRTVWYNPWYSGWYNWYDNYLSPWRWTYPLYTTLYTPTYYGYRYPRWRRRGFWGGRKGPGRRVRFAGRTGRIANRIGGRMRVGGRMGGGRMGGGRMGGGRMGGGRMGGGRMGGGRMGGGRMGGGRGRR